MRLASMALSLSFPLLLAGQAFAVPGIDGLRWHTQFMVDTAEGGGQGTCDVSFQDSYGSTFGDQYTGDADGNFSNVVVDQWDANGNAQHIKGNWSRGGHYGTFTFRINYVNGQASSLSGFYNADDSNGMQLPWNGSL